MPRHDATRRTVLRSSAGALAAATGLSVLAGSAAAHFPADLAVDVRPGSERNPINPRSRGVVPVAVLGTDVFDPTSEDVRYRFGAPDVVADGGGASQVHHHAAALDGDGRDDLLLLFPMADTGFDGDESAAELRWDRDPNGEHGFSGRDAVTIVGRPRGRPGK